MSNEQIEEIEISIAQAKAAVDQLHAVEFLLQNKAFISIITEGYFEKEASRLVLLKADPSMADDASQNLIIKSIDSIGFLRQYFTTIMQLGRMAKRSLAEDQVTREQLNAEALN